jgi:hypothetical protein
MTDPPPAAATAADGTAPGYCPGCGRAVAACAGCTRDLDPPRYCTTCGRRLTVVVSPGGYRARCRDHGAVSAPLAG